MWIFEFSLGVCSTEQHHLVHSLGYLVSNERQVLLRGTRLGGSATNRLLRDALQNNRWARDVTRATTTQVLCDYLRVWELLQSVNLQPLQPDRFVWRWSSSRAYSVSSTYWAFFAGSTRLLGAKDLWRTKAPPWVKLFFWLALHHRLCTADRPKRHGLQDDDTCARCDQAPETACHLFLGCVFSRQVWRVLLDPIHLLALLPNGVLELG